MNWTDLSLTVPRTFAEMAQAVATSLASGGLYIEDYSDMEQQVQDIAHIDLIEQELLDKPRDIVIIHLYFSDADNIVERIEELRGLLVAAEVPYSLETTGIQQEDWETSWKQYYHPIEIGKRLAVVPSWEEYSTPRTILRLDPGMAFGTGTHETTFLCLELLDKRVQGGENVLDVGTGSGILAVAALLLGAKSALGIDIDPLSVRTATENAQRNNVQYKLEVKLGDLAAQAQGTYQIITANIVADAIKKLAAAIPALLAPGGVFMASGIIEEREADVVAALQAVGFATITPHHKNGWVALECTR